MCYGQQESILNYLEQKKFQQNYSVMDPFLDRCSNAINHNADGAEETKNLLCEMTKTAHFQLLVPIIFYSNGDCAAAPKLLTV